MGEIYVVATADTKGVELAFLHAIVSKSGHKAVRVDVGTRAATTPVDITAAQISKYYPQGAGAVLETDDRGSAVAAMGVAFQAYCHANVEKISGIIGVGGGGGTSIITAGMRELPLGVPKVMVSTLASGDVAPYVDVTDIIMVPSITDIAGMNQISHVILHNAAQALLGMVTTPPPARIDSKPAIGLTMFGVTTSAVTAIADHLAPEYDPLIFHATGTGGRAMEALTSQGLLVGLIDITTTEIADLLFGGVLPCLPTRLDVVAHSRLPYVGSLGALDMINFWAPDTIPDRYRDRQFYHHNANVTLMRTTAQECAEMGTWIANKLNACDGPVRLLVPTEGFSSLDIAGGAFHDPDADKALIEALNNGLRQTDDRKIVSLPLHVNDPAFARAAADIFCSLF